jgi:hypothetical protein
VLGAVASAVGVPALLEQAPSSAASARRARVVLMLKKVGDAVCRKASR